MHLETQNRSAFVHFTDGLRQLKAYRSGRSLPDLQTASDLLGKAVAEDSQYLPALTLAAVVTDMLGRPADAAAALETILRQDYAGSTSVRNEVEYNLGVSWYHQYHHAALAKAEPHFVAVAARTERTELRGLALAGLAQTFAMSLIPSPNQKTTLTAASINAYVEQRFALFQNAYDSVEQLLRSHGRKGGEAWTEIEGISLNAKGMALMYRSDYHPDEGVRFRLVKEAAECLARADKQIPDDWANTCDIASVQMRLGVIARDPVEKAKYFEEAKFRLARVITTLRPNYGFAIYELGRVFRVSGLFDQAVQRFDDALMIDVKYRDVGDRTIEIERNAALARDGDFPILLNG